MDRDGALESLRSFPPFDSLDDSALKVARAGLSSQRYPKGSTIVAQDGPAPTYLYLITKGEVKVSVKTGQGDDLLVERLGEGGFFNLFSLISDTSPDNVEALEDTFCHLITREALEKLLMTNAAFSQFFFGQLLRKLKDITYREMRDRSLMYGGGDKLLFTNTLSDLASREVVTAPGIISIREAADTMSSRGISSLVLLDAEGFPEGIITDRDLRNKVVAKGRDIADPVRSIMSVALIKSEARDFCFEALLKMIRYNIHHLLVLDRGKLSGILTNHDLMMLQGTSPLALAGEIENQRSIEGLIPVARKVNKLIAILVREGAKTATIIRIITEINDRLLKRILEIAEKRFGTPPLPYCWIVFGSEGRKEQTFRTDQDNAIIYTDTESPEAGVRAEEYFIPFTLFIKEALAKCGFPECPADYMASNPRWCRPLTAWKAYFRDWIHTPKPESLLHSLIFFDFRPVHGDAVLAEKLRAYLAHDLKQHQIFLTHMAAEILKNKPPLDIFRRFSVEKGGPHSGAVNMKINGLGPIVDGARLGALSSGVYHTSTIERLKALKGKQSPLNEFSEGLGSAFEFIMAIRLRHQFEQMEKGSELDNFVNPDHLNSLERKMLRECFLLIARAQKSIQEHYKAWTIQ